MSAAAPLPIGGPMEQERTCKRCDQVVRERYVFDPQAQAWEWVQELHEAKCGLPCRRRERGYASIAEEHGAHGCPACRENHPRARKPKRQRRGRRR